MESVERIRAAGVPATATCAAGRDGGVAVGSCEGAHTGEPHEPQKRCVSGISHPQEEQCMCVLFHLPVQRQTSDDRPGLSNRAYGIAMPGAGHAIVSARTSGVGAQRLAKGRVLGKRSETERDLQSSRATSDDWRCAQPR